MTDLAAEACSTSLGDRTPSSGSAICGGPLRSSSCHRRTRPSLDTSIGAVRTSTAHPPFNGLSRVEARA